MPWYTTHKVLAGLRDAHLHRGSKPALDVLVKFADWIDRRAPDVPDDRFQKMLDREHGGMNEVLADVCVLTGDGALPRAGAAFLTPGAARCRSRRGEDPLDGLHANTQIPKVIGFSRIAETSAAAGHYDAAAKFFWEPW